MAAADSTFAPNSYRPQGGDTQVLRYTSFTARGAIQSENALWANCPLINAILEPQIAFWYEEDFQQYNAQANTGDWTATQATAGTAAIHTTIPGALLLDPGGTTAHEGIQIQRLKAGFIPALTKNIWFEVTVKLAAGLTVETFIGLAESNTTLVSGGALNTINNIGWSSVTGDGVLLFGAGKASTQSTGIAAVTLSTTVSHRLGFYYDGVADTVQQFIDGVATGTALVTANIPKVIVYPSFVGQTTGTTESTIALSSLRVFQLR